MLFADIKTDRDLDLLKRRIVADDAIYARFLEVRCKLYDPEGKLAPEGHFEPKKGTSGRRLPTNAEMLALYKDGLEKGEETVNTDAELVMKKFKVRSNSGVAVVSLLTKPFPCPGRCTYCPTEERMPKSYLSKEPAAARALANDFDPYAQVTNRLRALAMNGHATDKIEMIVIGGTWSFYHPVYQEEFLAECFRACNNFGLTEDMQTKKMAKSLLELQSDNETAPTRIIGLSIETRPDYITNYELERLRALGVTKVEIGVQHLDDEILKKTKRDMKIVQVKEATERLRNAGFKVVYHMMPNLPGSSIEQDIKMFGDLFSGEDYHPDMLKVYPCMVLEGSELFNTWQEGLPASRPGFFSTYVILCDDNSFYIGQTGDLEKRFQKHLAGTGAEHTKKHRPLKVIHYEEYSTREEAVKREKFLKTGFGRKWVKREYVAGRTRQAGGFVPYTDEELVHVLVEAKKQVPKYVRIIRVIRDIPATYIQAGSKVSNLRQWLEVDMRKNNWRCKCIRCREVRGMVVDPKDFPLTRTEYRTKTGREFFLSFEEAHEGKLASFLRLRLPDNHGKEFEKGTLAVLKDAALVRELHTYGRMATIGEEGTQSQHLGFGKQLLIEAERIAKEAGYKKVAIIAGIGVREYYKNRGYSLEGSYMVKYV
ncbi:hypothetical protein AUJ77_00265 [Candidatus Nomurabacteria bacterium CG1_02_43_90]|uniref:tRNA carboxymethyluridine synthase n=1 Tax=Candidatus Nomurabacteria bacterium CG1_02_43_90 TaxID=1805281 RepID=A0A1J4V9K5_9BACT|nr:MAG: hypothetical protein AUJ77_00265 [Candidatus Nomurabacteria bacterium CG1_02_43_90]